MLRIGRKSSLAILVHEVQDTHPPTYLPARPRQLHARPLTCIPAPFAAHGAASESSRGLDVTIQHAILATALAVPSPSDMNATRRLWPIALEP